MQKLKFFISSFKACLANSTFFFKVTDQDTLR